MKLRYKSNDLHRSLLHELCWDFSGPMLFQYVWWILKTAQERKINRLYFMARDGYLLLRIAERFCEKFSLPIELRYLYCSRTSLRMPSYCLIGKEADELLLQGGYQVSLHSLLQRAGLDKTQQKMVCADGNIDQIKGDRLLSRSEQEKVCDALRNSTVFHNCVCEKSRAAYDSAIGYLRQEGLLDQDKVVLVDSGWTGSMQRSLRQLLQSAGFSGCLIGFYFGMYAAPKESVDGTYLTWFFNREGIMADKIAFCNNLFECILSAPHGMTISYRQETEKYIPILLPDPTEKELQTIDKQIQGVLDYCDGKLRQISFEEFDPTRSKQDTRRRIWRYMAHPTRKEASHWGKFLFCDDVTEGYHLSLANCEQVNILKGYSIPARAVRRILRRPVREVMPELLWPYGTIAFLPWWKQWWYRLNVYVWEWLRYTLR